MYYPSYLTTKRESHNVNKINNKNDQHNHERVNITYNIA